MGEAADPHFERAMAILTRHADKQFIKRVLQPDRYPMLDLGNGEYATHKMAWGSVGNKHFVYPTVVLAPDGKLVSLGPVEAWQHALKNQEFIPFDSPADAAWFSENYKSAWGGKPQQ